MGDWTDGKQGVECLAATDMIEDLGDVLVRLDWCNARTVIHACDLQRMRCELPVATNLELGRIDIAGIRASRSSALADWRKRY